MMSARGCKDQFQRRGIGGSYMLFCSCGWTFTVPKQNALARAAKVKAAWRAHAKRMAEKEQS